MEVIERLRHASEKKFKKMPSRRDLILFDDYVFTRADTRLPAVRRPVNRTQHKTFFMNSNS